MSYTLPIRRTKPSSFLTNQRELFLSEVNNRETIAAIVDLLSPKMNRKVPFYCLQK